MKKEEIIYVRILTVIGASALMALILIFGVGSGLFQRIANGINDNTLQLNNVDAAIYSLYFYKGLDVLYRILYAVTVFGLILTAAAMFFKLKGAGIYAVLSSVSAIVTGAYIVLCSIFEGNTALRRMVVHFYLKDVQTVAPEHLLGLHWIAGVFLIVLGVFCLVIVKGTRLDKMKAYSSNSKAACYSVFIPVLMGSVVFEFLRELLISVLCQRGDTYTASAYACIRSYYFEGKWFFDDPYVLYLILAVLGVIVLSKIKLPLPEKLHSAWLVPGILTVIGVVRSIVYLFNAPPLFGYLTFDEKLCDVIESAYPLYMLVYILDMVFLMILVVMILQEQGSTKKILAVCGITTAVSIIGILICGFTAGLPAMYITAAAADVIGLIGLLYRGNIRGSHH